jgi:hypothetical protein
VGRRVIASTATPFVAGIALFAWMAMVHHPGRQPEQAKKTEPGGPVIGGIFRPRGSAPRAPVTSGSPDDLQACRAELVTIFGQQQSAR